MTSTLLIKFILNGLIAGSLYALLALGLSLIYGVLRFVNLAHGEIALVGAFSFYIFFSILGWPLIPSYLAGIALLFICVLIIERLTFLPVRDSNTLIPLIVSIGVGLFLKNLLLLIFEPYPRSFTEGVTNSYTLFGSEIIRITDVQIVILIAAVGLMTFIWAFLKYSKWGRAIRAVSENREVAAVLGIPVNRVITITFLLSAFLTGTAGILFAFDANLHPDMGLFFTVKSFAAVILGGIGSIPGAVLGGYFIGLMENILIAIPFGDFHIPSNYKDAIAFAALLILLYIRPRGLFGGKNTDSVRK